MVFFIQHYGERNKFVEAEIGLWIEALLDDCIPPKPFDELLRDGVLLCRYKIKFDELI